VGRTVRFAEASLAGESILTYARDNPAANAYRALAEFVDNTEMHTA
jgi:cellulose biosynthesis protein BcsQ